MSNKPIFTYQTRPVLTEEQAKALGVYADLYGKAERSLFAAIQAGGSILELKREFQPQFGISARQFNAMRAGLEGKIDSIKERRPDLIAEAEGRIRKAKKVIERLQTKLEDLRDPAKALKSGRTVPTLTPEQRCKSIRNLQATLHQKKRRLKTLQDRLATLQADEKAGVVRLCFGSKKLFHAQFDLEANGYASHEEWKADWTAARSSQFFVLGSQDETAGCQCCQATVAKDGSLTLQLRLPDAMATQGKYLSITGVRFAYGQEKIVAALASSQRIQSKTKEGKPTVKRIGTALSYRFVRDEKGWRILVSAEAQPVQRISRIELGAIGIDTNADHLAVAETDRFGNLIDVQRIDCITYGKSQDQAKALVGDIAVEVVRRAKASGKPIVLEKLDFQRKKAELEKTNPKQARMISSFACNKVCSSIKAAAFRVGVEVIEVNPAYTSVIGAVNYAQAKGISVHQGAAYAIARRGLGLSERLTVQVGLVPTRNGGHVTFTLPERNRAKHVWSFWSKVRTKLKAAHVAHFRCKAHKTAAPPLPLVSPGKCPIWNSTARSRGANRSPNCSGDVWQDVPC